MLIVITWDESLLGLVAVLLIYWDCLVTLTRHAPGQSLEKKWAKLHKGCYEVYTRSNHVSIIASEIPVIVFACVLCRQVWSTDTKPCRPKTGKK